MKNPVTKTYKISRTFNAPLDFVFNWCTDYREDDYKMTNSTARRQFLERTKERIVWIVKYKEGKRNMEGVRAVWLKPPDSWHFDTCGDYREVGDYELHKLGSGKTRLDMVFRVSYDDPSTVESNKEWTEGAKRNWAVYARFLEKDYRKSKGPA